MTVGELHAHFLDQAWWVDREKTADKISVGDPNREVRRVGTGWTACLPNLQAAIADGCDLFISHESIFCERWAQVAQEHGIALCTLHDTWDLFPVWGIRDSWARHLGLKEEDLLAERTYRPTLRRPSLALYRVPETTVEEYARHVAQCVREFGQEGVFVMGDGAHPVRRVAIGVGCHIPEQQMLELGADVLVQVFDRALQTVSRLPLMELGAHLILVEHGVAEMPAMRNMARYLREHFPDLEATFYANEPGSRAVLP